MVKTIYLSMGTSRKDKAAIKKLLENDAVVNQKVADLKTTIDELLDKPDFNKLYAEWKVENQGLPPLPPPEPTPDPEPNPEPIPEPTGDVLYDSHIHSKLHDGQVRTIDKSEGAVTPNGLGIECHASGNPRVQVNDDGTFSLLGDGGFPRFYAYVCNYDSILEIECAFWNDGGQDLSLKVRSRHNEGGACENRFGGYGLAVDRAGWDAKREVCHNIHDEAQGGKLPVAIKTKEYFTIKFTVKDQGNSVRQIGEINGQSFMNKVDSSPKPYMVDKASFDKQSYFWVRSNNSGHTEVRIKSLKISKA